MSRWIHNFKTNISALNFPLRYKCRSVAQISREIATLKQTLPLSIWSKNTYTLIETPISLHDFRNKPVPMEEAPIPNRCIATLAHFSFSHWPKAQTSCLHKAVPGETFSSLGAAHSTTMHHTCPPPPHARTSITPHYSYFITLLGVHIIKGSQKIHIAHGVHSINQTQTCLVSRWIKENFSPSTAKLYIVWQFV